MRTPLFRRLMRQLRIARSARAAGLPALEHFERLEARRQQARAAGLSRRSFLQLPALGAGAVAMAPLLQACGGGGSDGPRVVIVGAGLAGLHCAHRLNVAGVRATLYDSADRIGGRLFTDRTTFGPDQHCELGGELIDTGHMTMRDLAAELSLELYDYDTDDAALAPLVARFNGVQLTDAQILSGFDPIAAEIDAALLTLTDQSDIFVTYDNPNGGEALDALSLTAWLDQIGAAGAVRELLEVAYNIEYGLEADVTNVLNMMFLISTETTAFDVFGDSDERFHTVAGNDAYVTGLAALLDADQIETGAALTALAPDGAGYKLTFSRAGSTFDVGADHVVLALPFTRLREVDITVELPAVKQLAIDELGYGTNSKLMVGFSDKVWRTAGSNGETFTDLGYQSTWETSRLQPGTSGIITHYTGGAPGVAAGEGTPAERAAEFLAGFEQVFPGVTAAHDGKLARFHWPTHPHTKGSYSAYKVGQYTTITGSEIERVGNLHFCGEHTSLDAQGYMEGGALTGAAAADEVLADLGVDALAMTRALLADRAGTARVDPMAWPSVRILERARAVRTGRRWRRRLPPVR